MVKILNTKKGKSATNIMEENIMPKKITKKEFQITINKLFPDEEIEILDYSKASAKGKYRCNICGQVFSIYKMGDLTRKKHCCNNCFYGKGSGIITKQRQEKILKELNSRKDLQFLAFGYNSKIYKNTVSFHCNICGNDSSKQLLQFEKVPYCSYCSIGGKKINTAGFSSRLPEGYTLLEEYQGADKRVLFQHKCGFIWRTTPHNIVSGTGCPKCARKKSKGEKKIIDFLEKNNVLFEAEKTFDWSEKRRYDFFLPNNNLVIEYMGIQHYKDILFYGEHQLDKIQAIDKVKKEKVLQNGLQYLEISYEDFNKIEKILAQRLNIGQPILLVEDIV